LRFSAKLTTFSPVWLTIGLSPMYISAGELDLGSIGVSFIMMIFVIQASSLLILFLHHNGFSTPETWKAGSTYTPERSCSIANHSKMTLMRSEMPPAAQSCMSLEVEISSGCSLSTCKSVKLHLVGDIVITQYATLMATRHTSYMYDYRISLGTSKA
jgi:hypothetical protein